MEKRNRKKYSLMFGGRVFTPNGFSLVEVILAASVFSLIVTVLLGAYVYGSQSSAISGDRARAVYLAEEGLEAARSIRDDNFSNLADGVFGLDNSSGFWSFSSPPDLIGPFAREVLVTSAGPNRKKIEARVSWQQTAQRPGVVSLVTYLTNWMAVVLGGWDNPTQESAVDFPGIDDGWKVSAEGDIAVAVRRTGNPDFLVISVADTSSPSVLGSLNLAGGQEDVIVRGNYAYVASRSNTAELQIVDISNPASPILVGTYNAPGFANGLSVYVAGNTAYLVRAASRSNEFFVLDVSNPALPSLVASRNLRGGNNNSVVVFGGVAYIASDNNSQELKMLDVTAPAFPIILPGLNLPGRADADAVDGEGGLAIIGRTNGDIYTIDVSNIISPSILGLYNNLTNIRDLDFNTDSDLVYVASDENTAEFLAVDVSSPANPTLLSFLDLPADLNGVVFSAAKDRVFAVGDNNAEELIVIAPQ